MYKVDYKSPWRNRLYNIKNAGLWDNQKHLENDPFRDVLMNHMRRNNIFTGFALLFTCVMGISAQVKSAPNEVSIDRILRKENFMTLHFLVSTKDDVKALFGEQCASAQCVFDDDWYINFKFVGEVLGMRWAQPDQPKNRGFIIHSKPEYRGKLLKVEFMPRKLNVLPDNYIFPRGIDCAENLGIEFNCQNAEVFVKYFYKKKDDGTIFNKKISHIVHRPTEAQYKTIIGETVIKDEE